MGVDTKRCLVYLWRGLVFFLKTLWRSFLDHPYVWTMLFFTLLVYRFLPRVFAFFVYSSPAILCASILLGTLLIFGKPKPDPPKAGEEKEKKIGTTSAFRAGLPAGNLVEDKDAKFNVGKAVNEQKEIQDEAEERHKDRLLEGMGETSTQLGNQIDSSGVFSVKKTDDDPKASDSDPDHGKSSSSDASMSDIAPVLDELHPLLAVDVAKAADKSLDDFDAASERSSHESDNGIDELGEEHHGEEAQEDQDDGSAKVVTWTEDDEKNLKEIKKLELERDQKMGNLIAKRVATKNMNAMSERNLIDLDTILTQIPPLSTARRNPFDLPFDSEESIDLPPIPGSAPSVLLPRINPFDLPYDLSNERGSLDMWWRLNNEEFPMGQQKDAFLSRHESFTLGSGFPSDFKNGRLESSSLRPSFFVDRTGTEEAEVSSLKGQGSSEKSDSSASSQADQEEHKELLLDTESNLKVELVSSDDKDIKPDNQSQSYEDVHPMEREQSGLLPNASDISFNDLEEQGDINHHMVADVVDDDYKGGSSSYISTEQHEKAGMDQTEDDCSKWSTESIQSTSVEREQAEELQAMGPVYDSSPSAAAENSLSSHSAMDRDFSYEEAIIESVMALDSALVSDGDFSPTAVQQGNLPFSGFDKQGTDFRSQRPCTTSSNPATAEYQLTSGVVTENKDQGIIETKLSKTDGYHNNLQAVVQETVVEVGTEISPSGTDRGCTESQANLKPAVTEEKSVLLDVGLHNLPDANGILEEEKEVGNTLKEITESFLSKDAEGSSSAASRTTHCEIVTKKTVESNSESKVVETCSISDLNMVIECVNEGESGDPSIPHKHFENLQHKQSEIGLVETGTVEEHTEPFSDDLNPLKATLAHGEESVDESSALNLGGEKDELIHSDSRFVEPAAMDDHAAPITEEMNSLEDILHLAQGADRESAAPTLNNEKPQLLPSQVARVEVESHPESISNESVFIGSNSEKPAEMMKSEEERDQPEMVSSSKPVVHEEGATEFPILGSNEEGPQKVVESVVGTVQPEEMGGHSQSTLNEVKFSEPIKKLHERDAQKPFIPASGNEEQQEVKIEGEPFEIDSSRHGDQILKEASSYTQNNSAPEESDSSPEEHLAEKSNKVAKEESDASSPKGGE